MEENTRVTRAAGVVGAATLLSRILGFVRDVVIAGFFGAGLASDAFFVAFRIPNLLRRLFAEGSLSVAFIPVFTEYLTQQGKATAFDLARAAVRWVSLLLVAGAVCGIVLAPLIIQIIAPGFTESPQKYALTVFMTRLMFPYIFFIGLVALSMGILNVLGHFAAPALAPVLLNLGIISAAFWISPQLEQPVVALAIGVMIGGVLQLALQVPFLIRKGFYFWCRANLRHPGLKRIAVLMAPTVLGAAVYQINILIGTLLASLLPEGSVSYLYYADRLVQFPLGIFAIALATAVLPSLSRLASADDMVGLTETFGYAMKLVLFISIPAMVGLIILREPIVALLFKRGEFDAHTTRMTATALMYYSVGLWAFSGVRIVVATFYALQDTKTPVRMAMISIAVNIALGIALMGPLQHGGLALATALASILNLGLLLNTLRRRLSWLKGREILHSTLKTGICSLVMGAIVWAMGAYVIPAGAGTRRLLIPLTGTILTGLVLYGTMAFILRSRELDALWAMLKQVLRKV
jgi:putative peptidoglycan lipid II flippase